VRGQVLAGRFQLEAKHSLCQLAHCLVSLFLRIGEFLNYSQSYPNKGMTGLLLCLSQFNRGFRVWIICNDAAHCVLQYVRYWSKAYSDVEYSSAGFSGACACPGSERT